MPIYESRCNVCNKVQDYYQSVMNCHETPMCCGQSMAKVIMSAPYAHGDIPPYQSPITGQWIDSRTSRREDLKRSGSRPWEGLEQEKKESSRIKAYEEKKQDAKLREKVSEVFAGMSPEKKKALETT